MNLRDLQGSLQYYRDIKRRGGEKMNSSKKLLIVFLVCAALACSVVWIFSGTEWITSVSEEVPSEDVPEVPEMLPALTSHEEAISLADEFLIEKLGTEFFYNYFKIIEVDERPLMVTTWFVKYQYTCNGYTVDMSVAMYCGRITKDSPRIDVELSDVILNPQKILISEEEAIIIAQENGLEPSYTVILSCELRFHRICWRIVKEDRETLGPEDLAGLLIDAENGEVLRTWTKGISDRSCVTW